MLSTFFYIFLFWQNFFDKAILQLVVNNKLKNYISSGAFNVWEISQKATSPVQLNHLTVYIFSWNFHSM